ncbi:hypothetical protein AGABI2DRAFT_221227 [Agaricus bisporus var. bisporus H97]|uniref:hypothetical protein n=1 Tax=Agaricus bisporus var. bisporus (strain H97 / ATCC MYA-4626 / FGSC 10389) TaxID=936046 RepID=UPI00029F5034|nr:hypothetical protein AGABI2DRAFT_221227 [Agaricus bisporus var. bisporus H97]EKV47266.1 hypothetical protein AGABI2DRAFT_221227 [Agaricus bisporus var. bisporus H97]
MPTNIVDVPPEILLDNLFPVLPVTDLLSLTVTSKYFLFLCSDETLWYRKLKADYNFDGSGTARRTGWKFIYRGLYRPKVFVWGEAENSRLGLRQYPGSRSAGVPFPVQLDIPGANIIKLIAGGMSFHALDTRGNMYVWGTLDGTMHSLHLDGYAAKGKPARNPLKLEMPDPIRSISCGRLHSCSLDIKGRIWNFVNWGRPFRLSSHLLSQPDSEPIQIECGWSFSSALLKNGEVLVWWPTVGALQEEVDTRFQSMDESGVGEAQARNGIIPCHTWTAAVDPVLLPSLPSLPDIAGIGEDFRELPPRLIEIGGMDSMIIGLTNYGHVLRFRGLDYEGAIGTSGWQYLPEFSETARICQLSEFSDGNFELPETIKITHVSAHFMHFSAFSTGSCSIVLQGEIDTDPDSKPKIIPELQNRDIISVEFGDYHSAALSASGKLYTWGSYSKGALGLGDPLTLPIGTPGGFANQAQLNGGRGRPPSVTVPTEVRFDHGRRKSKDRFCFSVTAAGWHTGALVIDLEVCRFPTLIDR